MRSDPDLAAEARAGSEAAFEELVRRHQKTIRGLARRLTARVDLADDIAQQAFLTAWRKLGTYSGGTFKSWLCTITYREFLQAKRKMKSEIEFDEAQHMPTFDRSATKVEDRMDLSYALTSLTEDQRVCVSLCVAAGLTNREAALITGWPLGTVKSHIARGLTKLRTVLGESRVA